MMKNFHIFAKDANTEKTWTQELQTFQRGIGDFLAADFVFIDARRSNWQELAHHVELGGKYRILVLGEGDFVPTTQELALVDDLMVYPFRLAELLSKTRTFQLTLAHDDTVKELHEARESMDRVNRSLEQILHAKSPRPHKDIKGVNVMARHLSGVKPGGDYFDIFESGHKDFVHFLMADSSSYGVSSAFLGTLLSSSAKIAIEAQMDSSKWISAMYGELKATLGEKEHFSVFFGRLNRKDCSLHYQLFGTIEAFVVEREGLVHPLTKSGTRISNLHPPEAGFEKMVHLNPKDRIVLLSDGFVNGMGGDFILHKIFHDKIEKDPFDLVTELSYQIKSRLSPGEVFPGEDCSAIVIDVENRALRLAPAG